MMKRQRFTACGVVVCVLAAASAILLRVESASADTSASNATITATVPSIGGAGAASAPASAPAPAPAPSPQPQPSPQPAPQPPSLTPEPTPQLQPPAAPSLPQPQSKTQPQPSPQPAPPPPPLTALKPAPQPVYQQSQTGLTQTPAGVSSGDGGSASLPLLNIVGGLYYRDIIVKLASGSVPASLTNGVLEGVVGDGVSLEIRRAVLANQEVLSIQLVLAGQRYPFVFDQARNSYLVRFPLPAVGEYPAVIDLRYPGAIDALSFTARSLPDGVVGESGGDKLVSGAVVSLYDVSGALWPAINYGQVNPVEASAGAYNFVVPNGKYKLVVLKDGYNQKETFLFVVSNNIVNRSIQLIKVSDGTALDTAREQLELAQARIVDVARKAREVADDPAVEAATKEVVAPVTVGVATAVVAPSVGSTVLPLLRFMFLQPLLFVGRRRRREWGRVYNSLNKLPVDLAIVRLIDVNKNKVRQSQVTDTHGRYLFIVEPGEYKIEVDKKGFVFPTRMLATVTADGRMTDIYHGEPVPITQESATIGANIPLDPAGQIQKSVGRILWEKRLRWLQHLVSLLGVFATLISLYIIPIWYLWVFLAIHLSLYFMFVRYVRPEKPKGWGVVSDQTNNKPLFKVVARLFAKQYSKLVDSQITDRKGRYAFLVGPNNYYITFERQGYKTKQTADLDLRQEQVDKLLIKKDVAMEKGEGGQIKKEEKEEAVAGVEVKISPEEVSNIVEAEEEPVFTRPAELAKSQSNESKESGARREVAADPLAELRSMVENWQSAAGTVERVGQEAKATRQPQAKENKKTKARSKGEVTVRQVERPRKDNEGDDIYG